jgi:hypothetical protein
MTAQVCGYFAAPAHLFCTLFYGCGALVNIRKLLLELQFHDLRSKLVTLPLEILQVR